MFELHLDRRWLVVESWRTMLETAKSLLFQTNRPARIVVPPMSEEWLRQHEAEPPHGAD